MLSLNLLFILAQNALEKNATVLGVTFFGVFIFVLFLDSIIKGKVVPKNPALRNFLFFICFVCALVLFFLLKYVY